MIKKPLLHTHQTENKHCQMRHLEKGFFCFGLRANASILGGPSSAPVGSVLRQHGRPTLQCTRTTVNPEAVTHEAKQGGQVFLHSASFSVLCFRWWHTARTHCLKVLRLPHCFRILHHGVTSAVLNSLKNQIFHLANITLAKPCSSTKERAMWLDLQESLAHERINTSWVRVHLTRSSPYLLQGTAQFHWSSFEKSGARPAP